MTLSNTQSLNAPQIIYFALPTRSVRPFRLIANREGDNCIGCWNLKGETRLAYYLGIPSSDITWHRTEVVFEHNRIVSNNVWVSPVPLQCISIALGELSFAKENDWWATHGLEM